MSQPFDIFVALDGPVLNGMEGPGGILKLRYNPDGTYETKVKFYDGYAGGHAVQINKEGTIGYLGGFSRMPLFFDTNTLEEVKRFSTTNFGPINAPYESQTHVVFLTERTFITAILGRFYKFSLDDIDHPEDLGPIKIPLPHTVKMAPSGRYLFFGVMDHDYAGFGRAFGVFDLQEPDPEKRSRILGLDETAWHFQIHPTEDVAYAVSEAYDPQPGYGNIPFDFYNFTIGYRRNYAWKIDAKSAKEIKKIALPAYFPSHLTSDVVVLNDENDTILYNSCASSTITITEFATNKISHVDEKIGFFYLLTHPGILRAAWCNLVESFGRIGMFTNFHILVKALRTSRSSFVDGSYGLVISPDKKLIFSAHRGLNQILVYSYPDFKLLKRIKLPPARKFFPKLLSIFSDYRLGMHHAILSVKSALR